MHHDESEPLQKKLVVAQLSTSYSTLSDCGSSALTKSPTPHSFMIGNTFVGLFWSTWKMNSV